MRWWLGIVLTLVGAGLIVWGVVDALLPLIDYYRQNLENPMGVADGAEKDLSRTMLHALIKGGVGVVPLIAGGVILKVSLFRKLAKHRQERRGA